MYSKPTSRISRSSRLYSVEVVASLGLHASNPTPRRITVTLVIVLFNELAFGDLLVNILDAFVHCAGLFPISDGLINLAQFEMDVPKMI